MIQQQKKIAGRTFAATFALSVIATASPANEIADSNSQLTNEQWEDIRRQLVEGIGDEASIDNVIRMENLLDELALALSSEAPNKSISDIVTAIQEIVFPAYPNTRDLEGLSIEDIIKGHDKYKSNIDGLLGPNTANQIVTFMQQNDMSDLLEEIRNAEHDSFYDPLRAELSQALDLSKTELRGFLSAPSEELNKLKPLIPHHIVTASAIQNTAQSLGIMINERDEDAARKLTKQLQSQINNYAKIVSFPVLDEPLAENGIFEHDTAKALINIAVAEQLYEFFMPLTPKDPEGLAILRYIMEIKAPNVFKEGKQSMDGIINSEKNIIPFLPEAPACQFGYSIEPSPENCSMQVKHTAPTPLRAKAVVTFDI